MCKGRTSRSQRAGRRGELGKTSQGGEGISHENLQKAAGVLLHPPFSYTVASREVLARSPDLHPTAF